MIPDANKNQIYSYDKYLNGEPFLPAKDLSIGSRVVCAVTRLSSSHNNWQQATNKNHGWVLIEGIVTDIEPSGERVVTLDAEQVTEWEKPMGDERNRQSVGKVGRNVDHIVAVLGGAEL